MFYPNFLITQCKLTSGRRMQRVLCGAFHSSRRYLSVLAAFVCRTLAGGRDRSSLRHRRLSRGAWRGRRNTASASPDPAPACVGAVHLSPIVSSGASGDGARVAPRISPHPVPTISWPGVPARRLERRHQEDAQDLTRRPGCSPQVRHVQRVVGSERHPRRHDQPGHNLLDRAPSVSRARPSPNPASDIPDRPTAPEHTAGHPVQSSCRQLS